MSLTWPIVCAVLFGALLHASWNALIKSGRDKSLDTALIHVMGCVVALPLLLLVGLPPRGRVAVPRGVARHPRRLLHRAGRRLPARRPGLTYPIMRGLAPLLVALGSGSVLIGEAPSLAGLARRRRHQRGRGAGRPGAPGEARTTGKALAFALVNAAIIAVYTMVDGLGVRAPPAATRCSYVMLLFLLDGLPYFLLVWLGAARPRGAARLAYAPRTLAAGALGARPRSAPTGSRCGR